MTEHNCEIPGWRCHGNGPIVLEAISKEPKFIPLSDSEYYPLLSDTQVNYCPFCGFSLPMSEMVTS